MGGVKRGGRSPAAKTASGVVRRVDELGRIVIPVEIRKRFGLSVRDPLEISVRGDSIMLSKPHDRCVFCGSGDDLSGFHGKQVCDRCRGELVSDVVSARSVNRRSGGGTPRSGTSR
jgi:AbrB family transcriptional regulator, transcriptional pleiotropic regulator of transition state genes